MPLRWKLVALYALVLAAVIAGFSVAMVVALRTTLQRGVAAELELRARSLGAVVEHDRGAWTLESRALVEAPFAGDSDLYYRVSDTGGQLLLASPLGRQAPPAAGTGERQWRLGGRRFLERTLPVDKPADEDEAMPAMTLQVTCGKDLREVDVAVDALTGLLAWLGPLVLLLSLAGGLVLAGRALRPIQQIAATAAAIGMSDLDRRIAVRGSDELAALAATLNQTFDRLQRAFDRQAAFTADASHELRTPLAVVAGNVELALLRGGAGEQRELLTEIQAAARQMQALIDGLLALARADHGGLQRQQVALAPLCRAAVAAAAPAAAAAGVELGCGPLAEVAVPGDADWLQQLLANLLQNGIRYNRRGGHVQVRLLADDGRVRLQVEDDGVGVPAAALPQLGERFFRVDGSRARATGGVGLGLSIVRAIAQAHGGEVRFAAAAAGGLLVEVVLPRA